jgi:hypothetical protein
MNRLNIKSVVIISAVLLTAQFSHGQTSELFMLYSPNVIYPVGTTYVYQGGHELRSWTHVNEYEGALAVVGGTVRQNAVFSGFSGTEYTDAGVPTGTHYTAAPDVFDAASDGIHIYGWNVDLATLMCYDLNWDHGQSLFSLGPSHSYEYMGITYDPKNNTIWLASWLNINQGHLFNYSMDGTLLQTLALPSGTELGSGLAYDAADDTFWMYNSRNERLEQYSRNGDLLGTISERTRIHGLEFAVVPEPSVMAVVGMAALLFSIRRSSGR